MGMITASGRPTVSCLPGNKSRKEPVYFVGPYLELDKSSTFQRKWLAENPKSWETRSPD